MWVAWQRLGWVVVRVAIRVWRATRCQPTPTQVITTPSTQASTVESTVIRAYYLNQDTAKFSGSLNNPFNTGSLKYTGKAVYGNGLKANGGYENVVVAFRGTKGIRDIISDIGVLFDKKIDEVEYFETLVDNMMQKYKPDHVYTTGHSLGGYLAQYFASYTMQLNVEKYLNTVPFLIPQN